MPCLQVIFIQKCRWPVKCILDLFLSSGLSSWIDLWSQFPLSFISIFMCSCHLAPARFSFFLSRGENMRWSKRIEIIFIKSVWFFIVILFADKSSLQKKKNSEGGVPLVHARFLVKISLFLSIEYNINLVTIQSQHSSSCWHACGTLIQPFLSTL